MTELINSISLDTAKSYIQHGAAFCSEIVRRNFARNTLTPDVVSAFAALSFVDDQGLPIVPAAHHRIWLNFICDESYRKLLIVAPPDSAKTTWILAYLACYIGFFNRKSAIIASVTDGVASRRSLALRNIVDSDLFRSLFPGLKPVPRNWEENGWTVAPNGKPYPGVIHRSLHSYGTGSSIVGSRADLLIGDDILDFDNTRTAHQRQFVTSWFHNSFLSRAKGEGRVIMIGTSWNSEDLLGQIRRDPVSDWSILHFPYMADEKDDGFYASLSTMTPEGRVESRVKVHDGRVIWPERRSLTQVLALKATTPPYIWETTYQGSLAADAGFSIFKRSWYSEGRWRFDLLTKNQNVLPVARYISLDTASSEEQGQDYTAWAVGELMPNYVLDILEIGRKRVEMPELTDLINTLVRMYNRDNKLRAVVIENKSSGVGAIQTLQRVENGHLIKPYNPKVDKPTRWAQASVWCSVGMVWLPLPSEQTPWLADAEQEIFSVPSATYFDQTDAFAQLILYLENLLAAGYKARH